MLSTKLWGEGTIGISGGVAGEEGYCWVGKLGMCLFYFKNV